MLGELTHFPFHAEVWGNAASWFGAIGTSLAFLLAALAYRRDKKLRQYEQAVMVRMHETTVPPLGIYALNPENLTIEVHNTSERYIYSVSAALYRKSLYEIASASFSFSLGSGYKSPPASDRETKLKEFRSVEEDYGIGRTVDRLEPGGVASLSLGVPYTFNHRLVVSFVDAQNQQWQISEVRDAILTGKGPTLKFVGKRHIRFVRWINILSHIFTPPTKTARFYWDKMSLRYWAMKNGRWGPGVEGWKQKLPRTLDAPPTEDANKSEQSEVPDFSQNGSDVHK